VKICDSSYLIALLHPNPNPPMDRQGRLVTQFRERIERLVADLSATSDVIGIPTPALAETLVRSGPNRAAYMKVLGDSYKFQIVPFDSRAAIEAADLIALIKNNKDKWDIWAKVKFDIQIVAIAKAEGASLIYSDDHHIETYAKRFNIDVARICDLPLPTPSVPIGIQTLFDMNPPLLSQPENESLPTKESAGDIPSLGPGATESITPAQQTDPIHPTPVRGSDEGRAESKAPGTPS
jgi:predicted nucleic acid-binding protein